MITGSNYVGVYQAKCTMYLLLCDLHLFRVAQLNPLEQTATQAAVQYAFVLCIVTIITSLRL